MLLDFVYSKTRHSLGVCTLHRLYSNISQVLHTDEDHCCVLSGLSAYVHQILGGLQYNYPYTWTEFPISSSKDILEFKMLFQISRLCERTGTLAQKLVLCHYLIETGDTKLNPRVMLKLEASF